jgi:hypothetical protein
MSYINRGGPVFPQPQTYGEWADGSPWFEGLGLRDYFAAKAMQGLCALPSDFESNIHLCEATAKVAYMQADAMLKVREA